MKTKEIADVFQVSPTWARRVKQRRRETGETTPRPMCGVTVIKIELARLLACDLPGDFGGQRWCPSPLLAMQALVPIGDVSRKRSLSVAAFLAGNDVETVTAIAITDYIAFTK